MCGHCSMQKKIQKGSEKYNRPRNCFISRQVNEENCAQLSREIQNKDVEFQQTQALVARVIVAQLQHTCINLLLNTKQKQEGPTMKELTILVMNGLKLITYVYCGYTEDEKSSSIQKKKNEKFRVLCSNDYPATDKL